MSWSAAAVFSGATAVLTMFWLLPAAASMLAILIDTAHGCDRIENWPSAHVGEWLAESFFIDQQCLPRPRAGDALGEVFGAAAVRLEYSLPASVAVLFPILLLSMLEADSPMMPFSVAVWRSMATSWRAWAVFYLESAALVALAVFLWPILAVPSAAGLVGVDTLADLRHFLLSAPLPSVVGMLGASALVVAILMIYFRLLGRLAWCCMKATREGPQPSPEPPSVSDPEPAPGEYVDYP